MGKPGYGLRAAAVASAMAMVLAACGGSSNDSGSGNGDEGNAGPTKGGTLTFLTQSKNILHLDPQRSYTGEDLAFANGYLQRTLTSYKMSNDDSEANGLVPDLATDTGTSEDDAKTWSFTLKDGVKFEDGSPITCEDVKYGVSRTFAQDVITDGPTYAISMLDIPTDKDGASVYKGPYAKGKNDTAAFDKAVECSGDNKTITFHLKNPVGDFNYTVTLLSFSPVPAAADTGEKYDDKPISSGPYKIQQYDKGSQLVLVRNENWDPATDDYRKAYPDKIVMKFGLQSSVLDQRMVADSGADQTAVSRDDLQASSLAQVFNDPRFKDRRVDELDPYSLYLALRADQLNLKQRQAIMVAVNRKELQQINGGKFAGDIGDGTIKPNLAKDYAPTGVWDGLLGKKIPDEGDPEYAKQLIEESGEEMPTITFDYPQTDTHDKEAASIKGALARAGINVKPNPIESGQFYGVVLDPAKEHNMVWAGWGPDWANASTVIPELFTSAGGFDLTHAGDKAFLKKSEAAKAETDRDAQAKMWQELNKESMAKAWAVPYLFGKRQRLAGSKVGSATGEDGKVYIWAPYGSWPYNDMYVQQ